MTLLMRDREKIEEGKKEGRKEYQLLLVRTAKS